MPKLDRRQVLAMGAASTAALSMGMPAAKAAGPKQGGRLRMGLGHGSTTDSLDPATFENGYMQCVAFAHLNHLTEVDETGQLVPETSESFEASADAKTWNFKLRKGLEFHNGKSVTPDDVIASLQYHRGEDSKSGGKALLESVVEMKKDGDDGITFVLAEGNADFPFIVSDYHFAILPSEEGKVNPTAGIGTGGYTIEAYEPGVRTLLKKNLNYFKEGRAHFDEVEVLSITDPNARQNALITGEVDVIDKLEVKTLNLLARRAGINILETTGTQHFTFPMHTNTAPFDNNDVRLALKYALDREAIVQKVLRGHGALGNDHPIAPSNPYFSKEIPQRAYDPDKAKFHLKKAGAEGLKVELSASDAAFNGAVDAVVLYSEQAKAAGIEIEVIREPNDGYWSNVWLKKPWCACYWSGRPTEDWMFTTAYAAEAKWNDAYWKHDRFNELLIAARAELDTNKRREMYHEMQLIVRDEGGTVVPMFANHLHGLSDKVATPDTVAGNWQLDGNKSTERWWFA